MSQSWFIDLSQRLANGIMQKGQLLNMGDEFPHMLIAWCHEIIQFELGVAILSANVKEYESM